MMKSASTFLYQLTEEIFRAAGRKPVRLRQPFRPWWSVENYFDDIDPALLDLISDAISERDVVLKTHQGLHQQVGCRIEEGSLLASASIRDPREIALAMVDHGRRSARWGLLEFRECRTVFDTWSSLDNQVSNLNRWSALKTIEVFNYNDICFETRAVVRRIASQIGVAVDASDVLRPFLSKWMVGQFNRGVALRYREMPADEQSAFLDRYADLYAALQFDTPAAEAVARSRDARRSRARSGLGHRVADVRRILRP
jgi:hypothetical protein